MGYIIANCGHKLASMEDGISQERDLYGPDPPHNYDITYSGFYCKKCAAEYDAEMGKNMPNKATDCDVSPSGETSQTWEDAAQNIANEIVKKLVRKQHDYGPNNILGFKELGVLVRAWDKVNRLKNLLERGGAPLEESIEDSWTDLAGYSIIALMLRRVWFTLPLKEVRDEK